MFQLQGHENPVFEKTVEAFDIRFHPIVRRTLRYIGKYIQACMLRFGKGKGTKAYLLGKGHIIIIIIIIFKDYIAPLTYKMIKGANCKLLKRKS